jgi:hypothetical protein
MVHGAIAYLPYPLTLPTQWCRSRSPIGPQQRAPNMYPALLRDARRQERWHRTVVDKAPWGAAIHPDWEQGFCLHREELVGTVLPGLAFLSVEVVQNDGRVVRRPRPTLGRYAIHGAPRPRLLVPGARCKAGSVEAVKAMANTDVLIVNLQQLRGERSSQFVRAVLTARTNKRPTLAIAASPADVLFLSGPLLSPESQVVPIGDEPLLPTVSVSLVGRGPAAEGARVRVRFAIAAR